MNRPYFPPSIWLDEERDRRRREVVGELLLLPIKADLGEMLREIGRAFIEPLERAVEAFRAMLSTNELRFEGPVTITTPKGAVVMAEAIRLALDEERESE